MTDSKFQEGPHFNIAIRLYHLREQSPGLPKTTQSVDPLRVAYISSLENHTSLSLRARASTPTPREAF